MPEKVPDFPCAHSVSVLRIFNVLIKILPVQNSYIMSCVKGLFIAKPLFTKD